MLDHVEFAHVLYGSDIQPEEQAGLELMESAIIKTLLDHSITPNLIWMQGVSPGSRSLQLFAIVKGDARPLVEILADQIDTLFEEELVCLINENILNHW